MTPFRRPRPQRPIDRPYNATMLRRIPTAHLHAVTGRGRKCAPAAMSAVTGLTTERCAALLRLAAGRPQIHAVHDLELDAALRVAGWRSRHTAFPRDGRPTLAAWVATADLATPYILVVPDHYVAAAGDQVADNGAYFARTPQPVAAAAHHDLPVHAQIACRPDLRS